MLLPLIALIGGARQAWGATVGAFIVVFLPEFIGLSPSDSYALNGFLLVAIILLMPEGVLGGIAKFWRTKAWPWYAQALRKEPA